MLLLHAKTVLYLLWLLPLAASAQPTLIVRLTDDASSNLVVALDQNGAEKQSAYASLFEGVVRTQTLLRQRTPGKMPGIFLGRIHSWSKIRRRWQMAETPGKSSGAFPTKFAGCRSTVTEPWPA